MIILGNDELKQAEKTLKQLIPESVKSNFTAVEAYSIKATMVKVYGCLFSINRGKPHNLEIVADTWPEFNVIICKPKVQGTKDREGDFNIYSIYSKDKDSLKMLLQRPGVINWNMFTLLAGVDINHLDPIKKLAAHKGIFSETCFVTQVLILEDSSHLCVHRSRPGCTVKPLTAAHAELVNSTWKYGGDRNSYNSVLNYISNYPSLCLTEEGASQPVCWILMYQHCALGLLYTMPEHRGKGYAKLLVSVMAKYLLEHGYPVYCFVEEGNDASYRLFTSLGFKQKPSYKSVWFELNKREDTQYAKLG